MQLLTVAFVLFFLAGCANTQDVDDSGVIANGAVAPVNVDEGEEGSLSDTINDIPATAPVTTTPSTTSKPGTFDAKGEGANILYNIASNALKKTDDTLSYSVKCTYIIKPQSIKNCLVKTGYLPADAKNKVGQLLLETKNLVRKKMSANEAIVSTMYTCTKGPEPIDTKCTFSKVP